MATQSTLTPISWGRSRGKMVVDTARHLYNPDDWRDRTVCGVSIPRVALDPRRTSTQFWTNSETETAAQPPCGRCYRAQNT